MPIITGSNKPTTIRRLELCTSVFKQNDDSPLRWVHQKELVSIPGSQGPSPIRYAGRRSCQRNSLLDHTRLSQRMIFTLRITHSDTGNDWVFSRLIVRSLRYPC